MYWLVEKSQLTVGEGFNCPRLYSKCSVVTTSVEYNLKQKVTESTDKIIFGHKTDGEVEIELGFGEGEISVAIDDCLRAMKTGETQKVSVNVTKQFGTLCEGDTILFTIKLASFQHAVPLYEMTSDECLSLAQRLKEIGTGLFNDKRTHLAGTFYSKALKQLIILSSLEDSLLQEDTEKLLIACHSNLAACQLKLGLYDHVVENCSDALALDCNHLKALYRRASAFLALHDSERAQADVDQGLQIDPSNKMFISLKKELIKTHSAEDKLLSQRLSSMFSTS
uniref:Protein unc-45 homolog B-like n=1 Tax=Phallusia mammillata TaxID=59560 RepID=A0A6F9DWK1_9ASCI|nr:protein unc-45 homolog B-like [Phallusia mammillata]